MPDPESFQKYEDTLPGAADRILTMAESNTTHRVQADNELVHAEIKEASDGRNQAFTLTLIALLAAIGLFAFGRTVAGCALLSMPVALLIKSFISTGREPQTPSQPQPQPQTDQAQTDQQAQQ